MPKIIPLTNADKRNRAIQGQLVTMMKANHVTWDRLAKMLGISLMTMYRKRDDPERFTLKEVRRLQEIFPEIKIE